ncbi:MAG: hypothetical protein ONB24_02260 [candidate division KSB1 bacterium]|nr:hypothetical protein [candidate division KSB1 bacterium]
MTINEVVAKHRDFFMKIPGITGIGVGREGEKEVIVVLVIESRRQLLRRIPGELEGFPVVIRESGAIEAL